ncbi:MAG TPA: FIST C-terminal domain-containing protein, partial [Beijerinckia sp.]|nr:FIST C-terminal domain-containing protein [Beijerinckia sp.]
EALSEKGQAIDRKDTFALLLIDGMAANEEVVLASIHPLMDMIPLLGGSAGDNLRLTGAFVFFDGTFYPDAALLTVIKIRAPFRVLKCQHFGDSNVRMVVTRADPWKRTVSEINAEPAAREYARVLGLPESALTPTIFAEHPVMVKIGGDCHVRSIQRVNADDSLTFFCAIDEGVVLRLAQREDILANLADFFDRVNETLGPPQLVIGFDCILRSLALEKKQDKHSASEILAANNVIGFSTYGEQFASMHLNQTFTAVVIGAPHDTE